MSFNRLKYDEKTSKHELLESIGTYEYQIGTPLQTENCFPTDTSNIIQRNGVSIDAKRPMVDVNSDLLGINRKLTKDPSEKFLPKLDKEGNLVSDDSPKLHYKDCKNETTEYTRLSNPSSNLRGTGWNRWEWLCQDPQANLEHPFEWNTNSKLLHKDNHRPRLNKPNDNRDALPSDNTKIQHERPAKVFPEVPLSDSSVTWHNKKVDHSLSNVYKYKNNTITDNLQVPTEPVSTHWTLLSNVKEY